MSPRDLKLLPSVGGAVKKLSHLFRTPRQPLSHTRTSNPSPFTAVPFDVAEEILLYLPGQDIIGMKQVREITVIWACNSGADDPFLMPGQSLLCGFDLYVVALKVPA